MRQEVRVLSAGDKKTPPNNSNWGTGGFAILCGVFCALWAQNNKRNALLWFIGGVIFNVFAALFVLHENSKH